MIFLDREVPLRGAQPLGASLGVHSAACRVQRLSPVQFSEQRPIDGITKCLTWSNIGKGRDGVGMCKN